MPAWSRARPKRRLLLLLALIGLLAAVWAFELQRYLQLDALRAQRAEWQAFHREHPVWSVGLYVLGYAVLTGASVPGASLLTLAGGAAFGMLVGALASCAAATLGATLAFLSSRYLLRDFVRLRLGARQAAIDRGVREEGAFYLFALRLVPLFPFFAVNVLMGLTVMPARTYAWVSLVGILPGTFVYVNAGTQLAELDGVEDLASLDLLASLTLLGVLPLASHRLLGGLRRYRARGSATDRFSDRR